MSKGQTKFLFEVLKYFFNPFIFISLFGPIFIEHNLTMVKLASYQNQVNTPFKELLNNDYNYAFTSYNIQLFVLYLAVFFLSIETLGNLFKLLIHSGWENFKNLFEKSNLSSLLIIAYTFFIFFFLIAFFEGSFASPKIVGLYLEDAVIPVYFLGVKIPIPPMGSMITWWRFFILIYGVIFSRWFNKIMPNEKKRAISIDQRYPIQSKRRQ